MSAMLEIRGLTKRFGPFTAVDNVSFSVGRGEVLGFLGPNGSGKSTTMKMVTGFLPPTAGTAVVCGADVTRDPIAVKRHIGYLPEGAPLYDDMTTSGLLSFVAEVRGLGGQARRGAIDSAVDRLQLNEVYNQQVGTLSKGFKRRVGLALAILHNPDVLILDEPTDGLDPNQKHEVRSLIQEMAPHKAIIISTHILEEVDAVCSRAVIIARGRIVADGTPEELIARSALHNVVAITANEETLVQIKDPIAALNKVARIEIDGRRLLAVPREGADALDDVRVLVRQKGVSVADIRLERGRLEDVFRAVTTGNTGAVK